MAVTYLVIISVPTGFGLRRLPNRPHHADDQTTVVSYGGRYSVSQTYYSGHPSYRLATADRIGELLPGDISWNAKNVMPFMAIEDLPNHDKVLALVNDRDEAHFLQEVPGKWKWIGQKGVWVVTKKKAICSPPGMAL